MISSTAGTFHGFVEENCWAKAVEYIDMLEKPPISVLQTLCHTILLKSKDKGICTKAFISLNKFINLDPPSNSLVPEYYQEILFYDKNWKDWDDFLVCCKTECGYISGSSDGNYILVLQYFTSILQKEYEVFKALRPSSPLKHRECPKLIKKLIWGERNPESSSPFLCGVLEIINEIFVWNINEQQQILLECLVELICLAAECARFYEDNSEDIAISRMNCLKWFYRQVCLSKNIFRSPAKATSFLTLINLEWLRISICVVIINEILYNEWHAVVCNEPLTLRKIIRKYMLISSPKEVKVTVKEEQCRSKNVVIKRSFGGKTQLHEACADGKFGTLMQLLANTSHMHLINEQDHEGWTPLHEACYKSSYPCVITLSEFNLEDEQGPHLNVYIPDCRQFLPIHIAVWRNAVEIVQVLLNVGGHDQLKMKTSEGLTPLDLAESDSMRRLLTKYAADNSEKDDPGTSHMESIHHEKDLETSNSCVKNEPCEDEIEHLMKVGEPPKLPSSVKMNVYTVCLQLLLGSFCSFYDLQTLYSKTHDQSVDCHTVVRTHMNALQVNCDLDRTVDDLSAFKCLGAVVKKFCNDLVSRPGVSDKEKLHLEGFFDFQTEVVSGF